jgi:hypothetical protein
MTPTQQRRTADAVVDALNRMDTEAIISYRDPSCLRHIHPISLSYPPQDNAAYLDKMNSFKAIFQNIRFEVTDVVEDIPNRKICMWVLAKADTLAGEYNNEYVWNIEFNESGEKIVGWKEFVDVGTARDFLPKLRKEMQKIKEKQMAEGASN